eukprot:3403472-Amphidinium_carterae.1
MEPAHAGQPDPIAAQHQQNHLRVPNQTESADYAEQPCRRVLQLPGAPELHTWVFYTATNVTDNFKPYTRNPSFSLMRAGLEANSLGGDAEGAGSRTQRTKLGYASRNASY